MKKLKWRHSLYLSSVHLPFTKIPIAAMFDIVQLNWELRAKVTNLGRHMKRTLKPPLLLVALTSAAMGVVIGNAQRLNQPLPPALNRLSEVKLVEIKDEAGKVVLSGAFATTSDTKTEIERIATLAVADGATGATGKAEIEMVKNGDAFSKQELEVSLAGLAKAANFKLFVDDAEVTAFKTNKSGKAAMKFSDKNAKK
jgi:hypothetical protein